MKGRVLRKDVLTWRNVELRPNPPNIIDVKERFFPFLDVGGAPFTKSFVVVLLPDNKEEVAQRTSGEPEEIAQFLHGRRAVSLVFIQNVQSCSQFI